MTSRPEKLQELKLLESPLRGTNLIEAGAGTGKTYTITCLFLRLILEKRLPVKDILVVTYTVAATEELRDRIRKKIRDALNAYTLCNSTDPFLQKLVQNTADTDDAINLLRSALHDFDEASIFTIHGFCQRTLHESAFESGSLFDTELEPGQTAGILEEIARDFWRRHFYTAPAEFVSYALSKKFGPGFFMNLINKGRSHLDVTIIPEDSCAIEIDFNPFRTAYERLQAAWPAGREEVEAQLKHPGLYADYKKHLPAYMEIMDAYVDGALPPIPLPERFEKFTNPELQKKTKKGNTPPRHPLYDLCDDLQKAEAVLTAAMDCNLLYLKGEIFRCVKQELPVRKQRRNIQFFDDLLVRLRDALQQEGGGGFSDAIRRRYKAALIDEFQDTDPVQYAIFRSVFGKDGSILFLIGDPKQAIYSFRGADLFAYMKASGQVHSRYTLTSNWRSEPGLIRAVNTIFSNGTHPFLYREIPFAHADAGKGKDHALLTIDNDSEPPFQLWFVDAADTDKDGFIKKGEAYKRIPDAVAAEIARLVHQGRSGRARIGETALLEADIAVLTRSNREAQLMQKALSTLRIPGVLYSTGNLFDTDEALEMNLLLEGIANPHREVRIRAALATDMMGVSGEVIERLQRDEAGWEAVLNSFHEYHDMWNRRGFICMFRSLLLRKKVRSRLLSLPNGERRLTNVLHLSEVLHQTATEEKLGMAGLLKWLARQRDSGSPRLEEHQLRLESDANAVKIVTIHKSKGLEYPVVFCPFSWSGSRIKPKEAFTFHDQTDEAKLKLVIDPEGSPDRALAEKEALAENLRLLYVSITRARNRCYLVWGKIKDAQTSSLAYILHPPGKSSNDIVEETASHFTGMNTETIRQDLETLARKSRGAIFLEDMPVDPGEEVPPADTETEALTCREFTGTISREWQIASFSGLTSNLRERSVLPAPTAVDIPDHDQLIIHDEPVQETDSLSIFAFPRGARAGSLLHEIFELLDFTEADLAETKKIVSGKLEEYGFAAHWEEGIAGMINRVLNAVLHPAADGLTLSRVGKDDRLSELEFYFPLQSITPGRLRKIFAEYGYDGFPAHFPERIGELDFSPVRGFMKGFIDMVFQFKGRFYLIDWKSNYLGNRVEDYTRPRMAAEMEDRLYLLQSNLYVLALHQYLKKRLPGYRYRDHFGGVFYIFLRGVSPNPEDEFGIYRDLPGEELVEALSRSLIGAPG